MSDQLCDLPAHEIVRKVKARELSAIQVLESVLDRIGEVEGRSPSTDLYKPDPSDLEKIHAYNTVTEERARKQAQRVDDLIQGGEDPGPLAVCPWQLRTYFVYRARPQRLDRES